MVGRHDPAPPREPEPPAALKRLSETLRHPKVSHVGLTTTPEGEWALAVWLFDLADAPIAEIEKQAKGAPVVYLPARAAPMARPAFPDRGE